MIALISGCLLQQSSALTILFDIISVIVLVCEATLGISMSTVSGILVQLVSTDTVSQPSQASFVQMLKSSDREHALLLHSALLPFSSLRQMSGDPGAPRVEKIA